MKIIEPSVEILNQPNYQDMLRHIEIAGRTCYKSEDKINEDSAESFIRRIIDKNHLSVCEHCNISVRFVCDRGCCYDDETEILTRDGFKLFKDIKPNELVFTFNESTGKTEYQNITKQHEYDYGGNLICGKSSMVDFAVTPNHRMFYYSYDKRKPSWSIGIAEDIYGKRVKFKRGNENSWIGSYGKEVFPNQHSLAFAKFLGVFLTDGSKYKHHGTGGKVILHQTKPCGREYIKNVLFDLNWSYSEKDFGFVLYDTQLYNFLNENFTQVRHIDGRVPQWLKDAPVEYITSFMEGVIVGDGSVHHKNKHRVIYTTNKLLADDYQECLLKIGKCSTIRIDDRTSCSRVFRDNILTNNKPCYIVSITDRTNDHLFNKKHWYLKKYQGKVYCVTVPAGIVYVRRNGKSFWSGNSHELVRHRLCSFSQESTRFCNYSGDKFGSELTFIRPCFYSEGDDKYTQWEKSIRSSEYYYFDLLKFGSSPQEARSVLPNSLKTDIVVTANIRQWRTMFEQRCAAAAHPDMQRSMLPLLGSFINRYPVFFEDMFDLHIDGLTRFANKGWQLAEVKNA